MHRPAGTADAMAVTGLLLAVATMLGGCGGAGPASPMSETSAPPTAALEAATGGPTQPATAAAQNPTAEPPPGPTAVPSDPPTATQAATVTPDPALATHEATIPAAAPTPYVYLPGRPGPLRVDGFARVLAEDLVVRSQPFVGQASAILDPHLTAGDRLLVVAGPVEGSGYDWYQVDPMPRDSSSGPPFGWVAAASRDAEPWIEGLDVACPAGPASIAELVRLAPEERLVCYGDAKITFAAWARSIGIADGPMWGTPGWLVPLRDYRYIGGRTGPVMHVMFAPDSTGPASGLPPLEAEPWGVSDGPSRYRFTGHFDDPASASCRSGFDDPFTGTREEHPAAQSRLTCRMQLVITKRELLHAP
jgi:hypothetical protein